MQSGRLSSHLVGNFNVGCIMGSTALEEIDKSHEQVHLIARKLNVSSICSSRVRFSGFSSVVAGACVFILAMVALILTWPYGFSIGAVNINGFKEKDVVTESDSSWISYSSISCAFAIVPDNVTVGALEDYKELLTKVTPKDCKFDNYIIGVNLDTDMNFKFNNLGENHVGINLTSMISTYTWKPDYKIALGSRDTYQQMWIDNFDADSCMDISYAYYGQGKFDFTQGFQSGLNLSFCNENVNINFARMELMVDFSFGKRTKSDNLPSPLFMSKHALDGYGVTLHSRLQKRAAKEISVMSYIQKQLHLLFGLSGLQIIFFSVILDNSFNHQPERFLAFAILAPVLIFLGILAFGWFPRIPLWLIAFLKRRGFLNHVSPCSPWHDNVVTDFCGKICTLESLEQPKGTTLFLTFHKPLQTFLYGNSISPQETTLALDFEGATSTLEPQGECLHHTYTLQPQNDNSSTCNSQDYKDADMSGIIKTPPTCQVSMPNILEAPFLGEDIVVPSDHSNKFCTLDDTHVPTLTLEGPKINGFFLKVQFFKNMLSKDPTFDLTCTFRNKTTRKSYLTTQRLQNLAQNLYQWVENPHPIVTNISSDVLHCLAIKDILWELTKSVYSFKPVHVQHRYLAGFWKVSPWIVSSYVALWSFLSLFPLLSDKKSYLFLLSLVVLVPYLFTSKDINPLNFYNFRELFCPIFIYVCGFSRLYLSRSLFIWCNEFRKQRVVNPDCFWIDAEYSNHFLDGRSCYDVCGFVDIPDATLNIQSFVMTCQGWANPRDPTKRQKQHDCKLEVDFVKTKQTCYTNVTLYFYEKNDLLDRKHYSSVEFRRLHLIKQLFYSYTNPSFGGYVERICPGICSGTYLAHCPRFLDICHRIINENPIPTFLMAKRVCSSKFIIGVPF